MLAKSVNTEKRKPSMIASVTLFVRELVDIPLKSFLFVNDIHAACVGACNFNRLISNNYLVIWYNNKVESDLMNYSLKRTCYHIRYNRHYKVVCYFFYILNDNFVKPKTSKKSSSFSFLKILNSSDIFILLPIIT